MRDAFKSVPLTPGVTVDPIVLNYFLVSQENDIHIFIESYLFP